MFIYKLTNTLNNKIYIGLTTETISERCRKRIAEAKYRNSRNSYILNAIRKHGSAIFKVEQIDTASSLEELQQKEIYYIQLYNSTDRKIGYNLTKGGEGSLGLKMSDETKEKIRQKRLGEIWSDERRLNHCKALKSKNRDYSKAKENCKIHCLKTSKQIGKYTIDNVLIDQYDSISDAAIKNNTARSYLSKRIKDNKFYKNFIYKTIN